MTSARVFRNFLTLGAGEAFSRLLSFVAMVYLARQLGPALYGVIGVAAGIMLYLIQVADAGIELGGIPEVSRDPSRVGTLASAVITYRLMVAGVLVAIVVTAGLWLLPQPDGAVLAMYSLGLVLSAASVRWVYIGLERPRIVALSRVIAEAIPLLMVVMLVRSSGDIAVVPLASFVGLSVATLLMAWGLGRVGVQLRLLRDWAVAGPLFSRGRHLVLVTLLGLVLFNVDLLILRMLRGEEAAGYYAAAYMLIAFCANMTVAYSHSVMPTLARLGPNTPGTVAAYQSALANTFAVSLPVAVGGIVIADEVIPLLFGPAYIPSVAALQILLLTVPIGALREIPVVMLIATQRERELLRVNAITAAANVALNLALIPPYGIHGAAYATVATEVLRLVLASVAASAVTVGTPPWWRLGRPALAAGGMLLVLQWRAADSIVLAIVAGAATYLVFMVLTGAIRIDRRVMLRWNV